MSKIISSEDDAIIDDGKDVDISKISSCEYHSMNDCENKCPKYYSCNTIALANDILSKNEFGI